MGTPLAITNASKIIQWSADYYPFGSLYDEQLSVPNDVRFPGQWHDRETGLYYNWHRYYGPHVGRYYQPDPVGLASGDANLYRYVANRPTVTLDVWGLTGILIEIRRLHETDKSTIGEFTVTNSADSRMVTGVTLELPYRNNIPFKSRIKPDSYAAAFEGPSEKLPYTKIRLEDKHGRTDILIHRGKRPENTEGCILVGDTAGDNKIFRPEKAMDAIMGLVESIIQMDIEASETTTIRVIVVDPQ